jgi:hypothetical protein
MTTQGCIEQLEQAILAQTQAGVQLLAKGAQDGQSRGFEHPASFAPTAPCSGSPPRLLGLTLSRHELAGARS